MKKLFIILVVLTVAGTAYAGALKPKTLPGFANVSAVQEGTGWDSNAQPDEITWTVTTFGVMSTFTVTLDASIDYPCSTATYYPVGTLTEVSAVLAQGVDLTSERCFRGNLRIKTGSGGITNIKLNMRGLK